MHAVQGRAQPAYDWSAEGSRVPPDAGSMIDMFAAPGWDNADTASAYERFCRRHDRYRKANAALVAHAALAPGQRVLDVGAGTGRTADVVLHAIGDAGTVLCVEPARAMRAVGQSRVRDPRVRWTDAIPAESPASFDRMLCG